MIARLKNPSLFVSWLLVSAAGLPICVVLAHRSLVWWATWAAVNRVVGLVWMRLARPKRRVDYARIHELEYELGFRDDPPVWWRPGFPTRRESRRVPTPSSSLASLIRAEEQHIAAIRAKRGKAM